MRAAAIAMVLAAGCGTAGPRPAGRTPEERRGVVGCDAELWREAARSRQRAWLEEGAAAPARHRERPVEGEAARAERADRPVIVVAVDEDVRVAQISDGVIVARWVPPTALGRAAMAEMNVAASPGGMADPGRRILVGHPLPKGGGEWLQLREVDGLAVEGVVPARVRGTIWEEAEKGPPPGISRSMFKGAIRAEPRPDGAVRARTSHGQMLRAGGPAPPGWAAVIAQTRYAIVRGFVELPPPPPQPPRREPESEVESGGEEIEREVEVERGPFAPGECVYDAPGGKVAGMVLEDRPLAVTPSAVQGWYRFTLTTAWGKVAYYAKRAPRPPEPREEPNEWTGWPDPAVDWSRELR